MAYISVIIPVYNKKRYIGSTIESVLSQTFTNFELVLVNDGSTDGSLEVITSFKDCRTKIINKLNGGVSSARNEGIKNATGKWITFFDADDIMYPNALETYVHLIERYPDYDIFVAATDQSNKKYNSTGKIRIISDYDYANAESYAKSGFSLVNTDCICIRRTLLDKVGNFNEDYTHGEDQDLWKRLANNNHIVKMDKAIGEYVTSISNNSLAVAPQNRKYAPEAVLEKKREMLRTRSEKVMQGCRIFFYVVPTGIKRQPIKSLCLVFKYIDCLLLFLPLIIKHRVLNR